DLVGKTGGVRAQICDASDAWAPFFNAVAQEVERTSRVACDLTIPTPESGAIDPSKVNVRVDDGTNPPTIPPRVDDQAACADGEGWYYDDPSAPTKVTLCPVSCDNAQSKGGPTVPKVEVLFGCTTVVK